MPLDTHPPSAAHQSSLQWYSRLSLLGLCLAVIVALAALSSGLGNRWGWWDFHSGFGILKWAFYGGVAASVVSIAAVVMTRPGMPQRGFAMALTALILSFLVVWLPWQSMRDIRNLPPIHDITTDTENPPSFSAVLPLRGADANSTVYAGPGLAVLQTEAYPGIRPIDTEIEPSRAFETALAVVKYLDWDLVAADAAQGRIEATDTTFWFGFKDDVVIRITPTEFGSRVDLRSVSRVGGSDAGANAERIREFLAAFKARL